MRTYEVMVKCIVSYNTTGKLSGDIDKIEVALEELGEVGSFFTFDTKILKVDRIDE